MIILSILQCLLYLLIIPACLGVLFTGHFDKKYNTIGNILTCGFLAELGVFQLLFIVFYYFHTTFTALTVTYSIIIFALAVLSFVFNKKNFKEITYPHFDAGFVVFVLFILYMVIMRNLQGVNDGDDAFVLGNALTTLTNNRFYVIDYYTGKNIYHDYSRHVLASSPIFIAYLAKVSFIHPTILAHRILGSFYLTLHGMIVYNIGSILFEKKEQTIFRGLFASMVSLITIWDFHSPYTDSTFILTRTWQGKSMLCMFAISFVILLFIMAGKDEKKTKGYYVMLAVTCVAATAMTTGAIYFIGLEIAVMGCLIAIVRKKWSYAFWLIPSFAILGVFGLMYLYLIRG